jgi:hypothetical protein
MVLPWSPMWCLDGPNTRQLRAKRVGFSAFHYRYCLQLQYADHDSNKHSKVEDMLNPEKCSPWD